MWESEWTSSYFLPVAWELEDSGDQNAKRADPKSIYVDVRILTSQYLALLPCTRARERMRRYAHECMKKLVYFSNYIEDSGLIESDTNTLLDLMTAARQQQQQQDGVVIDDVHDTNDNGDLASSSLTTLHTTDVDEMRKLLQEHNISLDNNSMLLHRIMKMTPIQSGDRGCVYVTCCSMLQRINSSVSLNWESH